MADAPNPATESLDYQAMKDDWALARDLLAGPSAMRTETYIARFPEEPDAEYDRRVSTSPYTPLYADAFRNLASKPFAKEVRVVKPSDQLKPIIEDVDTAGSHLHEFAREVFKAGINFGLDWILVDYTLLPQGGVRLDQQRDMNARPFWARIPADRMLAVEQNVSLGRYVFTHARIKETVRIREGFSEREVERVRVLQRDLIAPTEYGDARFELWEKSSEGEWGIIEEGPMTIGVIPLVAFVTGERQLRSWVVEPPLRDLAYMQVTEFQWESNRNDVQFQTAYPVNVMQGVEKPKGDGKVALGPRTVLWFPAIDDQGHFGDFRREEPTGEALKSLGDNLEELRRGMREVGMQPLVPQTGNLTATATAVSEAKAQSAVESWALSLKDALERAFELTCLWLKLDEKPEVEVHTDFSVGQQSVEEMKVVLDMQAASLISGEQATQEAQRRNILGPTYDRAIDLKRLEDELPDPATAEEMAAALPPANDPNANPADPAEAA